MVYLFVPFAGLRVCGIKLREPYQLLMQSIKRLRHATARDRRKRNS